MNKSKEEIEFRILESKGKALLDREIMETFLSAVHERPQAQEIAKNLVNSYTGVGRILGREMDDLKVIEGVTDSAVAMIMCVKETLERVLREKLKGRANNGLTRASRILKRKHRPLRKRMCKNTVLE